MKLIQPQPTDETQQHWKKEVIQIVTSKRGRVFFGLLVGIIVLRLGLNWLLRSKHELDVPRVSVVQPEVGKMDQTLSLPGNIEALEQANLYAHVGGYLKKIYVDEGDHVKKGQLLAEIDAPDIIQ